MKGHVCILDASKHGPLVAKKPTPKCEHTPSPEGYLQWHDWAEKMSKTHRSVVCQHCGLYGVWIPKSHVCESWTPDGSFDSQLRLYERCDVCGKVRATNRRKSIAPVGPEGA